MQVKAQALPSGAEDSSPIQQDVDAFAKRLKAEYGLRDLNLFLIPSGDLKLNMIALPKASQGAGTGSEAMRRITDFADRRGLRMVLSPGQRDDGFRTTSRARLVRFYKRFGFVENKGRNKDFTISEGMHREPRPQSRIQELAQAAPTPLFYSPLLEFVQNAKQKQAPAKDWKAILSKAPGVKKAEMDWLGVEEWLDMQEGQVSRGDISRFVRDSQIQIVEDQLGKRPTTFDADVDALRNDESAEDWTDADIEEQVLADAEVSGEYQPTRFEDYTEDGGTNYREVLLRVPDLHTTGKNNDFSSSAKALWDKMQAIAPFDGETGRRDTANLSAEQMAEYRDLRAQFTKQMEKDRAEGRSNAKDPFVQRAHFEQENIVVHARVKDRTGPNGERVLFVEEIQSDLASKWRENQEAPEVTARRRELQNRYKTLSDEIGDIRARGLEAVVRNGHYNTPSAAHKGLIDLADELETMGGGDPRMMPTGAAKAHHAMSSAAGQLLDEYKTKAAEKSKVYDEILRLGTERSMDPSTPDTPFKEDHTYSLMVKRLLRMAADQGYDRLSWTPGYMQAERWDNAAQSVVESVNWVNDGDGGAAGEITMLGGQSFNFEADSKGTVSSRTDAINGKPLSQLVGPSLAKRVFSESEGEVSGQKITFPDSGYAIAYDQQTRKAVDKLGKKHGAKVYQDRTLPDFPVRQSDQSLEPIVADLSADEALNVAVTLAPDSRQVWQQKIERDGPSALLAFRAGRLANALEANGHAMPNNPVWSVDITPGLRNAAMQPQAMFQTPMPGSSAVTAQAARSIMPKLRAELDRLNLKRVSVRLGDMRKSRQGAFVFDGLGVMDILIEQSANPEKTLYHESIHAMRHLDLFTAEEWGALTREARAEWVGKHDINARYPHLTEAERIEEAVAEEFAERAASRDAPPQGPIRRAMRKIHRLLRAMRAAITGRSVEDIFDDAFAGRIGMRDAGSTGNMLTLNPEVGVREQMALFNKGRKPKERDGTFKADTIAHVNALNAKYGPGKTPEQPDLPAVFNMPERRGATKVREWFQDRFLMFEAAETAIASDTGQAVPEGISFRMKQNLFDGRSASRLESVIRDEVRPLTDAMRAENVSLDDLGVYLLAKHAPERNALMAKRNPEKFGKDGGSGLYNEAAKEIIQDFKDRGMIEKLDKVAKMARSIIARDLEQRRDAGLLSQEQFESYRDMYENYVPLRGAAERDDGGQIGRLGKGFDIRGKEVKEALGRQSLSENPVVQLIAMRQEGVVRSEKNRATRALFATVQKYPNPEVWETIGKLPTRETLNPDTGTVQKVPDFGALREDDVVGVKVQGETYYMRIKDPLMAEAVKNLTYQSQTTWARFFYNMGRITRTWSRLQTGANPNFVFPNGMSDFLEGIWTAYNADKKRMMRSYAKNYPIAMYYGVTSEFGDSWVGRKLSSVQKKRLKKLTGEDIGDTEVARFEKYRQEWESDGGRINFMAFRDLDEIARDITKVVEGADKSAVGRVTSAGLEGAFAAVEKVNQPVEMAGRLAMYVAGRENGMSREQAAAMSLDASGNYYRRGTLTRGMSSMYAFFNPAVQGIEKFVRFSKRPRNQAMMAGLIASNWALTKLFMAFYEDDEDPEGRSLYLDVPEYERNRSIIIPTGVSYETVKDEQGNPVMVRGDNGEMVEKQTKRLNYLSFRVPHNLRPLMALGQQLAILEEGFATPEEATHSVSRSILMNTNPMGGETFMNMVAPTVLDPAVDLTQNRNWTGGPVYPDVERWTEGLPRSYDYWERSTSDPSVWIAQTLNGMSGGDRYNPGNIDIQPGQIDFIARFMMGGLGRFVQDSVEVTADLASGADVLPSDIPIAKAVRNRTNYWPENDQYYNLRTEVNERRNRLRAARKTIESDTSTAAERAEAEAEYNQLLVEMNVGIRSNGNFNWTTSAPRVIDDADKALKEVREELTLVVNSDSLSRAERKEKSRELRLRMEQIQIKARKNYLDRVAAHGAATAPQ